MLLDCVIIGGGPAGLNAALVLGRAKRNVILFDDNQPRNAVTHEAHGFLTRDGIDPQELRSIARQEVSKYPSVEFRQTRVSTVQKNEDAFTLVTENDEHFQAKTVILATGLKETLPSVERIHEFYGKSLFNCPYCDGWEMRDRPLIVIAEEERMAFHIAKTLRNWSRDILLCTNGHAILSAEQKERLRKNEIQVVEEAITELVGKDGRLERVVFASGEESTRVGGLVAPQVRQGSDIAVQLGCETNTMGSLVIDDFSRTSVAGVYAAGDITSMAAQLIFAAAAGSRAAAGVNTDLIEKEFV
jgi:thioredoxin reductase